jgi:hypothetical protein
MAPGGSVTDTWPNNPTWCARRDGLFVVGTRTFNLATINCGELLLPSGHLVACDPFAAMRLTGNAEVVVPKGRFPVVVTIADVSEAQNGSHTREAYATLVVREEAEAVRRLLVPLAPGEQEPVLEPDQYHGFVVDAGTACFVDASCLETAMPPETRWEALFDDGSPSSWFSRMDDPDHIRDGIANIELPRATSGENLILFHSGWGDGVYPLVAGYASSGELLAVHIDFMVIPDGDV